METSLPLNSSPKAPTQRELADALGLSPATISKAFRNSSDISADTRGRILDEAARLGYRFPAGTTVNGSAAVLGGVSAEPGFIGVFYCSGEPLPGGASRHGGVLYFDGLSAAAPDFNASLVVHRVGSNYDEILDPAKQPPAFRDGLLKGLVLVYRFDHDIVRRLARQLPCVTVTHFVPNAPCDHVDSDHVGGMSRLVEHLAELGHRRIGYVGGLKPYAYDNARLGSYVRAMTRLELPVDSDAFISTYEKEPSYDAIAEKACAAISTGVTAWCAVSDGVARSVWQSLEKQGVQVPADVSITGFDANQRDDDKQVTTVATPFEEMGGEAVRMLMERVRTPNLAPRQILMDCPLRLGKSTGPVRD